jgi:hypothetical protein
VRSGSIASGLSLDHAIAKSVFKKGCAILMKVGEWAQMSMRCVEVRGKEFAGVDVLV